jgi:1-acyl-sn-glycerol-3-phosphate acyltransferase
MSFIYWLGHLFFREIARGFFDYRAIGIDNIQIKGPVIIVANHVSFMDPPLVGIGFDEALYFLARKSLFDHPIAGWIFRNWQAIPVDQDKPDPGSLKAMVRFLRAGKKVIIFPEGNRSEDGNLQRAEPGIGLVIAKAGVPVIPARVFGAFEALPRHKSLPQPHPVTVVYGRPWHVDLSTYKETGKELYRKLADEAMERIGELQA